MTTLKQARFCRRLSAGVAVIVLSLLAGCAPVEYADSAADREAKSFVVPEGMARIYVYRDDNVVINTSISVSVDGRKLGSTGNDTYVVTTVTPGTHTIVARGENTDELSVDAVAGESVFVQLGVGLGVVTNRANLILMDAKAGRAAVLETRLVE